MTKQQETERTRKFCMMLRNGCRCRVTAMKAGNLHGGRRKGGRGMGGQQNAGVEAGTPDRLMWHQRTGGFWMEFKDSGYELSEVQKRWHHEQRIVDPTTCFVGTFWLSDENGHPMGRLCLEIAVVNMADRNKLDVLGSVYCESAPVFFRTMEKFIAQLRT